MGTLYVVATPIGNLEDITPRASATLREVSLIAAEDTRHSRRLLSHYGIRTPLLSYHEHNQRQRRDELLRALDDGDVALISDAGTPAISDPGADAVSAALAAGHRVSPIPGPSALAAAISASGLIDGPFVSLGFLPRQRGERRTIIARTAASGLPFVVFESANRLAQTIKELESAVGERRAVVLRELTKVHEEVRAGTLRALLAWAGSDTPRGEIALVVAGAPRDSASLSDATKILETLRRAGLSASQAAREAAAVTGQSRADLYCLAIELDKKQSIGLKGELALADQDALQDAFRDQERPQ